MLERFRRRQLFLNNIVCSFIFFIVGDFLKKFSYMLSFCIITVNESLYKEARN